MPLIRKPMRYAHPEGHTDVCYYTGEKRGLITCGSDGDVRSWLNLMDDDPTSSCISEQAIAVVSKNEKVYVGNDNNTVQILTYPDLEKEGIVTRFSASVSALSTVKNSKLIASGACDMRIQVTNIETSDSIELEGHEAPVLGLSLDPKEEFVASSSADGSIRVWDIKEKRIASVWNNVVPKCNSFFTAKAYCTPSFHSTDGHLLAYPHNKDIVVVERITWKELYRLKHPGIRTELSICKFSECGTRLASSSIYGEIIVWDMGTKEVIGYIEHQQNAKITAIAWNIDNSDEIAFCDALGQLGCIDVLSTDKSEVKSDSEALINGSTMDNVLMPDDDDDDDDGENVISLRKIKASVDIDDDEKSISDMESEKIRHTTKSPAPEIYLQPPFQPGSSPAHLLSRFMVWNDTGMVRCFTSEDGEESSIEVEFHDVTVHRSLHINNYLKHTIATLSPQALALNCPASDDTPSKIVVVVLQGWGSGNKEWSLNLPEGEEGRCIAAGDNFIAIGTSRRNLRIFMISGTQREVIALPGPVVAMNALGNYLTVAYHNGVGVSRDQHINLFWILVRGPNLHNQILNVPLSPSSDLMWMGLTDVGSPAIMDADDVIKVYDKKSSLWRVACDMSRQPKGTADHYFLTGISEEQRIVRCVLCKGSYYPPTTPRPIISEIPLTPPLCEIESERTEKEMRLWQLGNNPRNEDEAMLSLIALACRSNLDYRAVELCEQVASQQVIELAIKYARRLNRVALANKLESIADIKDREVEEESEENEEGHSNNRIEHVTDLTEEPAFALATKKKTDLEIKPLSMNETLSMKRSNPFLKSGNSAANKGLAGLDAAPEKLQKLVATTAVKPKPKNTVKKETFVGWYAKNKKSLQEEFPDLNPAELTKTALLRYKEDIVRQPLDTTEITEGKKRKLSSPDNEQINQPKRVTGKTLSSFAFEK
ncbi:hypothetical protein KM043_000866 [Ampulex compressa]|nr:hypothetical protein KM043_000866 [Ampulex compressa]